MSFTPPARSVLLDKVTEQVSQKFPEQLAPLVNQFITELYSGITDYDLHHRNASDVYGATINLWQTFANLEHTAPYVRVYNPELQRHGWQSPHTIVEVLCPDAPFLVDSIRMVLARLEMKAHFMLHQPMQVIRNEQGQLSDILSRQVADNVHPLETAFLIEIGRLNDEQARNTLQQELLSVVKEVLQVVADWQPMMTCLTEVINTLPSQQSSAPAQEVTETLDFLNWVANNNFTLMGYRRYRLSGEGEQQTLLPELDTSLGLLRNASQAQPLALSSLSPDARAAALSPHLLILTKTNHQSRVHRPSYIDYIGVKRFDKQGKVVGEDRFIGLYDANIYQLNARTIPLIGAKIERVLAHSNLVAGSHAYKSLANILESYPRDELIQASEQELAAVGLGVLGMQERDLTRLFVRRDLYGRFFSCVVYVSKERFNTALRKKTQALLKEYFGSEEAVQFSTFFSEGVLARTHYLIRVSDNAMDIDVNKIQANLIEAARSWEDQFSEALIQSKGEAQASALFSKYGHAFGRSYTERIMPGSAVADIEKLEELSDSQPLGMLFYRAQEEAPDSNRVRLKLYHKDEPIHLSDVLPMLENLGLRIIGETPHQVSTADDTFWILDFSMSYPGGPLDLEHCQARFQHAFAKVWGRELENDGFNRLLLASDLTGREISVLRGYAKYMRQIGVSFSQQYIEETLARYPALAQLLFKLFEQRFSLVQPFDEAVQQQLHDQLMRELDNVANLDDDRIIRRFMEAIEATLRTNFYQTTEQGEYKSYISYKLAPSTISEMPKPLPMYEIFVYSPRVEGVHLRWGKVARGGLRWSDRREDFRTEVLGLVKAQQVKNTVIVPAGAKGGFVCKQLPQGDRAAFLAEGKACYRLFIRALLDVTDNIIDGQVVPAKEVVRFDDDDYYLVVAADKGTATFSDIANEISAQYQHWLGDAFASGGSVGYDHKKMAITARGGWESVKRHFRELGIDCQTTDFTAVGVGDMAGDVFGNGMLRSKHTRLVGAFNHLHIFIDPNPDAATSYQERERLFNTPGSSWQDFDKNVISSGGGVFERSAKSISLSPEMQHLLATDKTSLTPTEVIRHLLTAKVDLLWNGGIGTYVKSSSESNSEVGDRANDAVRVNGNELQTRIVGEGGNLGCTQLGRIEYANAGGRINADFIDNVGGVDCSDNEVNIKILLTTLVDKGELSMEQRNQLLYDMTDEVAQIVLTNAYRQSQTISITEAKGPAALKEQQHFIQWLERQGKLDRQLEYLPSDDELSERMAAGRGLTRPELAILVAYAKMSLKDTLNIPDITNNDYIAQLLPLTMPSLLVERFGDALMHHPLRGEIIATRLANILVNDMGFNFAMRLQEETGASMADIAHSFMIARDVFGMDALLRDIEALDNQAPAEVQLTMFNQVRRIIRRATRWLLRSRDRSLSITENIAQFKPAFACLAEQLPQLLVPSEASALQEAIDELTEQGVSPTVSQRIVFLSRLFSVFDLAQIAKQQDKELTSVARLYFHLGAELELHWFLEQINQQAVSNHWQAQARAAFREDLDEQQRNLTAVILKHCKGEDECANMLAQWLEEHDNALNRWRQLLTDFKVSSSHEFAQFSVALRELNLLHLHCLNAV
ncbi:NAD-glutamate dehydrogenase [Oceanisphaera avium]|uniref:NAD-glutamate dehydrogenase n=1 Tax=Oceanisphaera avium TaxID=1903694 RepID=A0A1Y0CVU6_9GAMM|nr:NAD-glutamate dehydrogenase [Oceanisphaera avium]ART79338.1 NAD-glutamate dehydrogenase [Oceanisphaera avium]